MKRAWSDGTRALVLEPMEFIRRLCAFVPPPYMHTVRYFGVLAPHSALRAAVVPKPPPVAEEQLPLFMLEDVPLATPARTSSRISWAQLLKRVFRADVNIYNHCGGNVRVTDAVTDREEIRKKLDALGLPSEPPGLHPGSGSTSGRLRLGLCELNRRAVLAGPRGPATHRGVQSDLSDVWWLHFER